MSLVLLPTLLLVSVLPQDPPPAGEPGPSSAPTTMAGPMRADLEAVVETRYWFGTPPNERMRRPEMRLRFKISGSRLGEVARVGQSVIFDELVDDTGRSLLPENGYSEADRKATRLVTERDGVAQNGLLLMATVEPSSRGALTLKKIRGSVRLLYASQTESITIENPLQFRGQFVAHPRLDALGVKLRLLPEGNPAAMPPGAKYVAYEVVSGAEKIRDVGLYDAWMKRIRAMPREMESNEGTPSTVIQMGEDLDAKTQMVIEVFTTVEETVLPIEMENVKLP